MGRRRDGASCAVVNRPNNLRALRLTVNQISLMSRFGGSMVETQVVAAGGFQAFVAENLFDVADRAAVKQKLGRGSMAK